jgi:hypothetical protein
VTAENLEEKLHAEESGDETAAAAAKRKFSAHNFSVTKARKRMERMRATFNFMEDYSFFVFALLFVIFNIVYWSWLFTASEYLDWVAEGDHKYNGMAEL